MASSSTVSEHRKLKQSFTNCAYNLIEEDDEAIRQLLKKAGLKPEDKSIQLECINKEDKEGEENASSGSQIGQLTHHSN